MGDAPEESLPGPPPETRGTPCTPRPVHARVLGHGLYDSTTRVLGHDSVDQKSVPGNMDLLSSRIDFNIDFLLIIIETRNRTVSNPNGSVSPDTDF